MTKVYCPSCAKELHLKDGIDPSRVLETGYQRRKHKKHTRPASTSHHVQSLFDSSCTDYYREAIQETIELGFVYGVLDSRQAVADGDEPKVHGEFPLKSPRS